jgi:hypothetical protein
LIPATVWVVVGYFILFSSAKIQGLVKTFGQILSVWVFIVAAFFPMAGAYVTFTGLCPSVDAMIRSTHPGASS